MRSPWITGVGPKCNDRGPYKGTVWREMRQTRRHKKERRRPCEDGAEMEDASSARTARASNPQSQAGSVGALSLRTSRATSPASNFFPTSRLQSPKTMHLCSLKPLILCQFVTAILGN